MPTMRAISRMDFPCADNSCMLLMVPLLIMATSLVSKINTSVAFLKGWVNSFLAFMGQLYGSSSKKVSLLACGREEDQKGEEEEGLERIKGTEERASMRDAGRVSAITQ